MRKAVKISTVICTIVIILFYRNYGYSCTCIIPELEDHFSQSEQVFLAKVLWIEDTNHFYPTYNFGGDFVTLEIISVFKNTPTAAEGTRISTIISSACPFSFDLEKQYLIFGNYFSSKEVLFLDECSVIEFSSINEMNKLNELRDREADSIRSRKKNKWPVGKSDDGLVKTILLAVLLLSLALNLYFLVKKYRP